MRVAERATPIAAVIAALSTLACCLPLGFLGAVGLAGLSVWARSYAGWFLALAAVLLILGSWPKSMQEPQHGQYRTVLGRCCNCSPDHSFPASHRELGSGLNMRSKLKFVPLFIVAALACLIFWYFWGSPPSGQPPLTSLSPNNLDQFRREFNGAVDRSRMVLLLSPT